MLNSYRTLNFLLFYLPLAAFSSYGVYKVLADGLYSDLPFHLMHVVTLLGICLAYAVTCRQYRFVPQPRRSLLSLSLIITVIYASGMVWDLLSHLSAGVIDPNWYAFVFNFLVGVGLVYFMGAKRGIFKFSYKLLIFPLIALGVYAYMWFTGFFYLDTIYMRGGPDPIYEPIWLVHKLTTSIMLSFSFQSRPENRTVDWKLV